MNDKFKDECGVIGIYNSNEPIDTPQYIYYGLYALQHRGQESAGIAVSQNNEVRYKKGMGLVTEVFQSKGLDDLKGCAGIGHVRYSTTGESYAENAQPLVVKYKKHGIALAHNGNLVNAHAIRAKLEDEGVIFQTSIDTEVIANLFARHYNEGIEIAVKKVISQIKGAYALVILVDDKIIGIRDPHGLRPLCIGHYNGSYVLASETCALDTMGYDFIRDVAPGEIIIIDKNGLRSMQGITLSKKQHCIFELVYFARPDSIIDGVAAQSYRYKCGRILAQEAYVEADRVIAVPDSGTPAAIGFAEESGIPYGIGLIKNRYIGRTFIQPTQELREQGVKIKLNVLRKNVENKRIVVIDDSIVRGTTSKRLVQMFKKAGAKEIHFRISSPPVKFPCHFGIDTPSKDQLIGAQKTVEEIRAYLGVDSLAYISVEGLIQASGMGNIYCKSCFDGKYPMPVPNAGDKHVFEKKTIKK